MSPPDYSPEFLENWQWRCKMPRKHRDAYRRLANRINYLALYEYSHTVEDLKIKVSQQQRNQEELENKLSNELRADFEARIDEQNERLDK